jgi:orotate phosphoribosyltransferase
MGDAIARETICGFSNIGLVKWSGEPFKLKSGIKSNIYVFGRNDLTEDFNELRNVGMILARAVWDVADLAGDDHRNPCPIGIPTAGTALAAAAALSPRWGNFPFRIMREMQKTYGAHKKWVDGSPQPDLHKYLTIDNVATDGASKAQTAALLKEDGYPVEDMKHIVLIDRQQGAVKKLAAQGITMVSVFNLLDVVWAFGELKLWPKDRVKAVEEEIAAHQLA